MKSTLKNIDGVTLIELIVAIVSASIVLSFVFFSWNYITFHTTTIKRRDALKSETSRIANDIAMAVRHHSTILSIDDRELVLTGEDYDTIRFQYTGEGLQRNGSDYKPIVPLATVTSCTFTLPESDATEKTKLLQISVSLANKMGDTSNESLMVDISGKSLQKSSASALWNF